MKNGLKLHTKPKQDAYYMPAEYARHMGCLMAWPTRPGSWGKNPAKAQRAFSEIITVISKSEKLFLFVSDKEMHAVKEKFAGNENILICPVETDDAWMRDTGATFVIPKGGNGRLRGIDWQFNAWGGSYDGLYASWDKDQLCAEEICRLVQADCYDARHFVLEGGSIHVDGEGTLMTTEECLLSKGRNPGMSKAEIEAQLMAYLGVTKIIWLPYGIYQDETNGHVDNFCCFTAPGEVLLAWTEDADDPQYERSQKAYEILRNTKDAAGRTLRIRKLPIPKIPVCITQEDLDAYVFEEGEDEREVGERLAASYVNFYISNQHVLVPQFGGENAQSDDLAVKILAECFPSREIVPIYARDILTGGGNIHCITQQIPEVE